GCGRYCEHAHRLLALGKRRMPVAHCVADEARDEHEIVLRVLHSLVALHRGGQQQVRVRHWAKGRATYTLGSGGSCRARGAPACHSRGPPPSSAFRSRTYSTC
ncbi:hypothetical protein T492DRAFT_1084256, partial [Pavlovales sp. CCMP2436]